MTRLPTSGAPNTELAREASKWWADAAAKANVVLTGFNPNAPVADRIASALRAGLAIATIYSRFSSKQQHSTSDQVRECVIWAAQHGMYAPRS